MDIKCYIDLIKYCNNVFGIDKEALQIKKVISVPPKTIVIFEDGKKITTTANGEKYDVEKGIMVAITRYLLGKDSFDNWWSNVERTIEIPTVRSKKKWY